MRIIHVFSSGVSGANGITNAVEHLCSSQRALGETVLLLDVEKDKTTQTVKSFKPDIVSFHGLYYNCYLRISCFLIKNNIPFIIHFHGSASSDNYRKHRIKKAIANVLVFNHFITKASAVVYLNNGEYTKSIFKRFSRSYFFLSNGVDINPDYDKSIHNKVNFLFFSRIDIYGKGLDVLADVIKRISNSVLSESVVFSFYGYLYESSKFYFDQFAGSNIVKYCGIVNGEEKDYAYNESDIVILPSRSEGMPLTVLEAFSYGRPVLVTPETNMGDIVSEKNVGWVCRLNKDELYDTILKAIKDYLNDIDGYRKRSYDCSLNYSWERIAKQSIEEYNRFLY